MVAGAIVILISFFDDYRADDNMDCHYHIIIGFDLVIL